MFELMRRPRGDPANYATRGLLRRTGMDNFCCSHRCLHVGTLVRDGSVLVTPARPANYRSCVVFL